MLVQELHLCLNLAEMRDGDKVRFLMPHLEMWPLRRLCRGLCPAVPPTGHQGPAPRLATQALLQSDPTAWSQHRASGGKATPPVPQASTENLKKASKHP